MQTIGEPLHNCRHIDNSPADKETDLQTIPLLVQTGKNIESANASSGLPRL